MLARWLKERANAQALGDDFVYLEAVIDASLRAAIAVGLPRILAARAEDCGRALSYELVPR